jgi:ribosomal L7/L12-like protein
MPLRQDYSKAHWHALLATNDTVFCEDQYLDAPNNQFDRGEKMVTEANILLLKSRINELEDRLKFLYRRLNIEYADPNSDPALAPQVQDALRRGNKIEAIKIYRELTGVGLAEAKQVIDRAEQFIK